MKTCPDCAESVQDAARKCRYCGYRFDSPAGAPAAAPEVDDPPAAGERAASRPAARPANWPFALVALGGALLGVGGAAMLWMMFTGAHGLAVSLAAAGMPAAGLVLALAWSCLLPSRRAEFAAVFGALALPASFVLNAYLGSEVDAAVKLGELAMTLGLLGCAFGHLGTLERLDLDGTRLCAQLAMVAFGVQAFSSVQKLELPGWLYSTCDAVGLGGTVLLGFGLAIGALGKARA